MRIFADAWSSQCPLLRGENLLFGGQNLRGLGAEGFGQIGQLLLQKGEGPAK